MSKLNTTNHTKSKYAMIMIWLTLCTMLVAKRKELGIVFLSFLSSFCIAALLLSYVVTIKDNSNKKPTSSKLFMIMNAILNSAKISIVSIDQIKWIEMLVGIIICQISIILLFSNKATDTTSINKAMDEEFLSLGIVTGYLAFDLWWVSLFKFPLMNHHDTKNQVKYDLIKIFEDAITLSMFLIALYLHVDDDKSEVKFLQSYRSHILCWTLYKFIRLLSNMKHKNNDYKHETKKQLSHKASAFEPKDKSELWNIYGKPYDLEEFVHRHPGGVNAIELGKGRDCTALFESYHPFTDMHWYVYLYICFHVSS